MTTTPVPAPRDSPPLTLPKAPPTSTQKVGLRESKKAARKQRILAAATRLFAEHGYDAVTTAQIADAAQVGMGTLFRNVGSKAELLVLVMNERIGEGIESGLAQARKGRTVEESILAILAPLAQESMAHPENMLVYEREALFGPEPQRASATARVFEIEGAIAEVLRLHDAQPLNPSADLDDIAHAIYATLYVDIIKVGAGHTELGALPTQIRGSVAFLVSALLKA